MDRTYSSPSSHAPSRAGLAQWRAEHATTAPPAAIVLADLPGRCVLDAAVGQLTAWQAMPGGADRKTHLSDLSEDGTDPTSIRAIG